MNWAYLHILTNHFPIVGIVIGTMLLISGMVFKNEGIRISGLGTIVFASIMAIVADLTGDPAKDALHSLPGISESLINRHEDIASASLFLMIPCGLLAVLTIYSIIKKERSVFFLTIITLVLSLVSCAVMGYVGHTGGQIKHDEFRSESTIQYMVDNGCDKA
ncbi:MAG: hypothetical protein U0Z17_11975 [Bacteroidales bacterium]